MLVLVAVWGMKQLSKVHLNEGKLVCGFRSLRRFFKLSLAIIPVIHGSNWPAVSSGKWIVNIAGAIMAFGPFIFLDWQVQLPWSGWASIVPHCEIITPNMPNVLQPCSYCCPAPSYLPRFNHPPLYLYVYLWFSGIIPLSENLHIIRNMHLTLSVCSLYCHLYAPSFQLDYKNKSGFSYRTKRIK